MSDESTRCDADRTERTANRTLLITAVLSTILYCCIALLSWRFGGSTAGIDRPIIAVMLLFAALFLAYAVAIVSIKRMRVDLRSTKIIVSAAILFRLVMLCSLPIQEVDLYRYLWDGAVMVEGISPFAFSPAKIQEVRVGSSDDQRLQRLAHMLDREPSMQEVLERVHFAQLPTIYPSVSQAVFAVAHLTTPSQASLFVRVLIIKAWLVGFDIATLLVVIALLQLGGKPIQWCLIYAWCPLLMKEVANSGHLDAIAIFLATLAVYWLARSIASCRNVHFLLAGFCLALAVGAKLYPIVLVPLFAAIAFQRRGFGSIIAPAIVLAMTVAILLYPMAPSTGRGGDPSLGVVTFLKQWEMNDFLFLNVIENIKPTYERGSDQVAWFTVVPDKTRVLIVESLASRLNTTTDLAAFLAARMLTGAIVLIAAFAIAWRFSAPTGSVSIRVSRLAEAVFLTLAWFWLLCPTQNPWYWLWALPFLPFARSRAWLAVSGLVMLYYLRFWFGYHYADSTVPGSSYTGVLFFDFVVTWIEFGPWFVWLGVDYLLRNKRGASKQVAAFDARVRHSQMSQPDASEREDVRMEH